MTKFLITKKLGMTTIYEEGKAQNVTLLEVGKNVVTDLRDEKKNGYNAVQVGLEKEGKKEEFETKGEFRVEKLEGFEKGKELTVEQFEKDEKVNVQAIAKGKGYQGVVKRHGFSGGPASHGHRHALRSPGSIGSAFPQHVMKGKKMAGRMGGQKETTENLRVVSADKERKILAVRGAVPGNNGTVVRVFSK